MNKRVYKWKHPQKTKTLKQKQILFSQKQREKETKKEKNINLYKTERKREFLFPVTVKAFLDKLKQKLYLQEIEIFFSNQNKKRKLYLRYTKKSRDELI